MTYFFVDRGGTFTDVVAVTSDPQVKQRCLENPGFTVFDCCDRPEDRPEGDPSEPEPETVVILHKLLSENPDRYSDAVIQGIRNILGLSPGEPIGAAQVRGVKMGTTVATNALLERRGDPVVVVMTEGLGDALAIGYQNRPDLFALHIQKPSLLYQEVIEARERIDAQGQVVIPLDRLQIETALQRAYDRGIRSCAIVLMHSYRYPQHEITIAEIAANIGFSQISRSSAVSPLIKYIYRGDTTVVDAYLSPLLRRYVAQVQSQLPGVPLAFMQSHGGLVDAAHFQGRDSILSGPAGGIVGAVKTSQRAGFNKIITFDMGGTSTDVAHFAGEYERLWETEIAGVRMRVPSLAIHTVAAGGGSILKIEGQRYQVGPTSAGANPGPACYRRGGPLTVTDANLLLGRLQADYFPAVFGPEGNLPLDGAIVGQRFTELAQKLAQRDQDAQAHSLESIAEGFLTIAVENVANAIQKISLQRGYDLEHYTLCCFGGAGGQVVCRLAERLGMSRIFLHPYGGVLSAYGMGLAEQRVLRGMTIEKPLTQESLQGLRTEYDRLWGEMRSMTCRLGQGTRPNTSTLDTDAEYLDTKNLNLSLKIDLKYEGTDTSLSLDFATDLESLKQEFAHQHQQRYGFIQPDKPLWIAAISLEYIEPVNLLGEPQPNLQPRSGGEGKSIAAVKLYVDHTWQTVPLYDRRGLSPEQVLIGPALILEGTGTIVLERGWKAYFGEITDSQYLTPKRSANLILERLESSNLGQDPSLNTSNCDREALGWVSRCSTQPTGLNPEKIKVDPVRLEVFKNRYQFIAEQMGIVLQNTAASVNIKERLDFSCAIFDRHGDLVANAPHIPVHLGSMSESVKALMRAWDRGGDRANGLALAPGQVYLSNNPYNGGTHLPDVTVITPMFDPSGDTVLFYLASRGHQADLGGITPGSMPPHSQTIGEEGILFDNQLLVDGGVFQGEAIQAHLLNSPYPARNPAQNLADFQAQIAANVRGIQALTQMIEEYDRETVEAYMQHVQDNAEQAVRQAIGTLRSGEFTTEMDNGIQICVRITVDAHAQTATIDFSGTSPQGHHNFNTPVAVVQAVVLYVFRTLVQESIPLNAGCLKPLQLIIPPGCLLNPQYPAAVVAGNVETSQTIADTLYGALGCLAASQGTMNNLTFGNAQAQYYETICGGSGAGTTFAGTDAVQTHMTNSRITDPEVLESRFPVRVDRFAIRPHSGGAGQFPGGNGVIRQLQFLAPLTVSILSNRRRVAPFGLAGGGCGQVGENWLIRATGGWEPKHRLLLDSCAQVEVEPGDRLLILTPGGGGLGHFQGRQDTKEDK